MLTQHLCSREAATFSLKMCKRQLFFKWFSILFKRFTQTFLHMWKWAEEFISVGGCFPFCSVIHQYVCLSRGQMWCSCWLWPPPACRIPAAWWHRPRSERQYLSHWALSAPLTVSHSTVSPPSSLWNTHKHTVTKICSENRSSWCSKYRGPIFSQGAGSYCCKKEICLELIRAILTVLQADANIAQRDGEIRHLRTYKDTICLLHLLLYTSGLSLTFVWVSWVLTCQNAHVCWSSDL